MNDEKQILFDKDELGRTITRMAHEVIEKTTSAGDLVLIGIRSRGVYLARRMARKVHEITGKDVPVGVLDVSSYRDDRNLDVFGQKALAFEILVSVNEQSVVLVDDVIQVQRHGDECRRRVPVLPGGTPAVPAPGRWRHHRQRRVGRRPDRAVELSQLPLT